MEPRSRFFHDRQLVNGMLLPQVILRTGFGDRVWGFLHPEINDAIGPVLASGDVFFTQAEFSGEPVL